VNEKKFEELMLDDALDIFSNDIDAILLADAKANTIRTLVKRGVFSDFIEDSWKYTDLIEKLWYHFNNSADDIDKDYHVFLPTSGKFVGKYSRRINIMVNDIIHVIQMMIYPVGDEQYMILLDELDKSMFRDEDMTNKKVDTYRTSTCSRCISTSSRTPPAVYVSPKYRAMSSTSS
jgi:hypothetical protein